MSVSKIFTLIYILVFIIGGSLQYIGVFTNSSLTIFLVALMVLVIIVFKSKLSNKVPYIALSFVLFLSSIINESAITLTFLYFLFFILTPFISFNFIWNYRRYLDNSYVYKFLLFVGFVQLPILLIQKYFASTIASHSGGQVSEHDVGFGSFFLSNDHALGFFLLCLITYILFTKEKTTKHIFMIIYFSISIMVSNSNVSFVLLGFVLFMYVFDKAKKKTLMYSAYTILILIFLVGIYINSTEFQTKVYIIEEKIFNKDLSSSGRWIAEGKADRFDIISFYSENDVKIIGEGPYDYFNPLKKQFNKFGNFSQYLWFYNDLGILGLFSIFWIYWRQSRITLNKCKYTILGLVLVFSFFTNTLSDLATNLTFSIFLLKK